MSAKGSRLERWPWQVAVLLAVCVLMYWVGLGVKPLDFSEGHRAVPGWTMLRTGEWMRSEMFGLNYVRKPPGMAWAIAGSSAVLGETAFAARAVSALSATLLSLLAWSYARRWFGARWALAGGLAQALMPAMWSPGRSAEIEMLMLLGAGMMALGGVALAKAAKPQTDRAANAFSAGLVAVDVLICAAGIVIAALAKGPATANVLVGVVIGAGIAQRSWRAPFNWRLGVALALAAGVLVPLGIKFTVANADADGVREDVAGQFLWSASRVGGVALLGPAAWASMLPMSVAVVLAVLAWWRREASDESAHSGSTPIAWTLAWAWVISVAVLVLAGVSNHRYALASAVLLGPLVAWGLGGWEKRQASGARLDASDAPAAPSTSRTPVATCVLGALLTLAGGAFAIVSMFPTKDQQAGVELAARLAEAVPPGVSVWADDAIEARPDILWMLQQRTDRMRKNISVQWGKRDMLEGKLPRKGDCLLLRTDPESSEADRYKDAIVTGRLERLTSDTVRRHEYTLFRVQYNAP